MWKNYLKISFRNLWKNKSFTFINIIGLAVGLAVSFTILLYVVNEVTYDRFHEKSDRIYRFAASMDLQDRHFEIAEMPIPFGPALKEEFPEVKNTTRIHLYSHLEQELEPPGNLAYIRIFTAIGLFILLIAGINFVNLSTARSAKRAKEVGMRKVLGAHRSRLAVQFLGESVILSIISLTGALVLISLWLPIFNRFIMKELTFHPFQDWSLGLGMTF